MVKRAVLLSLMAVLFGVQMVAQTVPKVAAKVPDDVNIVNTPSVNVVNTPTVQLAGTSTVQVSGTTNVHVQNDSTAPVIVQDVSTPKRTPFQANATFPAQPFTDNGTATGTIAVPAGKRLVIEHASGRGVVPFGDATPFFYFTISTTAGGVSVEHSMDVPKPFSLQCTNCPNSSNGVNSVHAVSQEMKLYADPGSTIQVSVLSFSPIGNIISIAFAVSGYLEDAP
jgi:hypothetical protein